MTVPQKICPQCQTSAPLEAAFCRQCGRRYRTQFTSASAPGLPESAPAPPAEFAAASPPLALSRRMMQTLVTLGALVIFLSILAVHSAMQPRATTRPAETSGLPQPPPYAAPQVSSAASNDPVNDEAKRFIEQEKQENGLEPPSNSVGPDGRIHLQNGGSITREEWDRAKRAVQQSQSHPPMPAPPVP